MKPLTSVAIITYNQKDFLKECIESVLSQDYQDIEIVVADDCSTDGTQSLLLEYKNKYDKIFKLVLADKNQGITANSNAAFFNCQGKYIAWMGGDDLMLPGKLRKQVDFMESNPDYAICYHDVEVFDSDSNKKIGNYNSGFFSIPPCEGKVSKLIKRNFIAASSALSKKAASPISGFDTRLPSVSDWFFFIETAMNGKIGYIPEILGKYRRHRNNFSAPDNALDSDYSFTLALMDSKYPQFFKYTRIARANYFSGLGARAIKKNQKRIGRRYLFESLRLNKMNWRAMAWIFISFFNKLEKKISEFR